MNGQVLVVEDDPHIADLIKLHLGEAGFTTTIVSDGSRALGTFTQIKFSIVILDLMLPGLNGNEVIKQLRAVDKDIPILITTVKSDLMHKIVGFELGADDYLAKPFNILELVARVKALLRRTTAEHSLTSNQVDKCIEIGAVRIDPLRHKVFVGGKEVKLSPTLFQLLHFLIQRPGRAFTRGELLTHVWNYEHEGYEHTVDTHVNRLRGKIEPDAAKPRYVLTVWGVGYRFAEPSEIPVPA